MNTILKKWIVCMMLLTAGLMSNLSLAFADSVTDLTKYVKITEPDDIWIKYDGKGGINSTSSNVHIVGSSLQADYRIEASCGLDRHFISAFDFADLHFEFSYDQSPHKYTFSIDNFKFIEIKAQGSSFCADKAPGSTHIIKYVYHASLTCQEHITSSLKKVTEEYTLEIPMSFICGDPAVDASVEDEFWTYTCAETPQNDAAFWQKYRLVVEGTDSNQVRTSASLGEPYCVPFSESDGSQMNKVIWKAN